VRHDDHLILRNGHARPWWGHAAWVRRRWASVRDHAGARAGTGRRAFVRAGGGGL